MNSSRRVADWEPGPVVAWTESDGPGRLPPVAPRRLGLAAGLAAGVALWGMDTADAVCPEHSLLIEIVASLAMMLTVVGLVAAFRSSVAAAPLVLAGSVFGFFIGVVDVLHDPTRSRVIAIGFAVAAVLSAFSAVSSARIVRWERTVVADAERPLDAALFDQPAPSVPDARPTAQNTTLRQPAPLPQPQASEQH